MKIDKNIIDCIEEKLWSGYRHVKNEQYHITQSCYGMKTTW